MKHDIVLKRNCSKNKIDKMKSEGYEEMTLEEYFEKENILETERNNIVRSLFAINIHQMISKQTLTQAMETINDYHNDERLKKMNAIVFLSLKTKGRGEKGFTQLSQQEFAELTRICLESNIPFGFDSCGANKFIASLVDMPIEQRKTLEMSAEPCESSLFSVYIDTFGKFHPCSFSPDTDVWGNNGLNVLECKDFIEDIWNHDRTKEFRKILLDKKRNCPLYRI